MSGDTKAAEAGVSSFQQQFRCLTQTTAPATAFATATSTKCFLSCSAKNCRRPCARRGACRKTAVSLLFEMCPAPQLHLPRLASSQQQQQQQHQSRPAFGAVAFQEARLAPTSLSLAMCYFPPPRAARLAKALLATFVMAPLQEEAGGLRQTFVDCNFAVPLPDRVW